MLDYIDRYPGQVADGDAGYPHGKAQNVVVEGDGNGTPLEADLVNDIFGMQQALLVAAGVTPSGVPETALTSDFLKALYRLGRWARGWGAVGDGTTDDTTALQAGLNAVSALGAGLQEFHLWPGATYRHTGLTVPANVSIIAHGATLQINHASNHGLSYGAGTLRQKLVGAVFTANVANTGASVKITAACTLHVENCSFGASTNCNGKFIDASGITGLGLTASHCEFRSRAAAIQVDLHIGVFRLEHCTHRVPSTYSVSVVKVGTSEAWIEKPWFDVSDHTTGAMVCIELGAGTYHIDDANFSDNGGATATAISWGSNACKLIERGSTFGTSITPYAGSVVLAEGSWLDLRPHGSDVTTDDTYILPDDYRAFALSFDVGSGPLVGTMPTMRFPGQEYSLQLYNADSLDVADIQLNALGPPVATGSELLEGGRIRTGLLKVMRDHFQDRWYWMLIGDWSTMFGRADEVTG